MTKNVAGTLSWGCLSSHVAGHSQPREERSQHNLEGRSELITMASSLFWSRIPDSLLLSPTLSSLDQRQLARVLKWHRSAPPLKTRRGERGSVWGGT